MTPFLGPFLWGSWHSQDRAVVCKAWFDSLTRFAQTKIWEVDQWFRTGGNGSLKPYLGGGFIHIFYFHPDPWGKDPIWRAYFSNGLVQPPTSYVFLNLLHFGTSSTLFSRRYFIAIFTRLNAYMLHFIRAIYMGCPSCKWTECPNRAVRRQYLQYLVSCANVLFFPEVNVNVPAKSQIHRWVVNQSDASEKCTRYDDTNAVTLLKKNMVNTSIRCAFF